jgi:hypothetical protein
VPDLKARRELVNQTWDGARMGVMQAFTSSRNSGDPILAFSQRLAIVSRSDGVDGSAEDEV